MHAIDSHMLAIRKLSATNFYFKSFSYHFQIQILMSSDKPATIKWAANLGQNLVCRLNLVSEQVK
jgi:hypothetical protein